MLYCVGGTFADVEALKQGMVSGVIETKIVNSAAEEKQALAAGYSVEPMDFIAKPVTAPAKGAKASEKAGRV